MRLCRSRKVGWLRSMLKIGETTGRLCMIADEPWAALPTIAVHSRAMIDRHLISVCYETRALMASTKYA
jgi:hypothetical protein